MRGCGLEANATRSIRPARVGSTRAMLCGEARLLLERRCVKRRATRSPSTPARSPAPSTARQRMFAAARGMTVDADVVSIRLREKVQMLAAHLSRIPGPGRLRPRGRYDAGDNPLRRHRPYPPKASPIPMKPAEPRSNGHFGPARGWFATPAKAPSSIEYVERVWPRRLARIFGPRDRGGARPRTVGGARGPTGRYSESRRVRRALRDREGRSSSRGKRLRTTTRLRSASAVRSTLNDLGGCLDRATAIKPRQGPLRRSGMRAMTDNGDCVGVTGAKRRRTSGRRSKSCIGRTKRPGKASAHFARTELARSLKR